MSSDTVTFNEQRAPRQWRRGGGLSGDCGQVAGGLGEAPYIKGKGQGFRTDLDSTPSLTLTCIVLSLGPIVDDSAHILTGAQHLCPLTYTSPPPHHHMALVGLSVMGPILPIGESTWPGS